MASSRRLAVLATHAAHPTPQPAASGTALAALGVPLPAGTPFEQHQVESRAAMGQPFKLVLLGPLEPDSRSLSLRLAAQHPSAKLEVVTVGESDGVEAAREALAEADACCSGSLTLELLAAASRLRWLDCPAPPPPALQQEATKRDVTVTVWALAQEEDPQEVLLENVRLAMMGQRLRGVLEPRQEG